MARRGQGSLNYHELRRRGLLNHEGQGGQFVHYLGLAGRFTTSQWRHRNSCRMASGRVGGQISASLVDRHRNCSQGLDCLGSQLIPGTSANPCLRLNLWDSHQQRCDGEIRAVAAGRSGFCMHGYSVRPSRPQQFSHLVNPSPRLPASSGYATQPPYRSSIAAN